MVLKRKKVELNCKVTIMGIGSKMPTLDSLGAVTEPWEAMALLTSVNGARPVPFGSNLLGGSEMYFDAGEVHWWRLVLLRSQRTLALLCKSWQLLLLVGWPFGLLWSCVLVVTEVAVLTLPGSPWQHQDCFSEACSVSGKMYFSVRVHLSTDGRFLLQWLSLGIGSMWMDQFLLWSLSNALCAGWAQLWWISKRLEGGEALCQVWADIVC